MHSTVNALVDAVFVLSVRSFHDRIAHITSELARHGIAFEWIFEHDASELTPSLIDATFAPSDMGLPQQSLVLKHIETWKLCVARGYRRILVFEDDAMLAPQFEREFEAAMRAADLIKQPYMIYLGCGNNKYARPSQRTESVLVQANLELPATDALVVDQHAARLRLEYVARHRITRPADWLMREADAAMGIAQYWLRDPVVEQGSMNGRFDSVLDRKRIGRSRTLMGLRFRWDRWWRRHVRSSPVQPAGHVSLTGIERRRDIWALATTRACAALVAIGAFTGAAVANLAALGMLLGFIVAPSFMPRVRQAWNQPLGKAAIVFLAILLLSIAWSSAPFPAALKAWLGWRHFVLLFIALAVFDTRSAKLAFAAIFVIAASAAAVASFVQFDFGAAQATSDVEGGIVLRNHVTQGMALTSGALLALALLTHARRGSWQQWACAAAAALMVANVVFVTYARSAYLALVVTSAVATLGIARRRIRIAALGALIVLMCGAVWMSPLITQRIERGLQEIQETQSSTVITPMGIRPVMWETAAAIVREAPLIGHGLGSFPEQYRRVVTQRYTGWKATLTADPHNQYLLILAETGLFGLAVFAWFLFSALRQGVRGSFGVIGIALLVAWSLTSLFSSHFHTFNEGHLIAVLLGVCLARERPAQGDSRNAESTAARTSS